MERATQIERALALRELHRGPRLLILPNVWDPLGARLLQSLGYPAVATASAAVAYSLGWDDGERIGFDRMLGVVRSIAEAVEVPVSADVERGYASGLEELAENVHRLLDTGAVGLNLEDSFEEGGGLRPLEEQCARIGTVRAAAEAHGIPLFLNARIDVFMARTGVPEEARLSEALARGRAYLQAGADGLYPIGAGEVGTLRALCEGTGAPINVYAREGVPPVAALEALGVRRLSLGPGLLKASVTAMKRVAEELAERGTYESFTAATLDSEEIVRLLSPERR